MRFAVIGRVLGLMIWLFSAVAFLPAIAVSELYGESHTSLSSSFYISIFVGGMLFGTASTIRWVMKKQVQRYELRVRDGFIITVLFWTTLSLLGTLPFALSEELNISWVDAIFESFSGLTTTGATVISGLDTMERGLLIYRQLLQWIGGIGIIVIAVAVLPALGVGGLQLYKSETPGPVKDSKLTPRIAETAKSMASIYIALTIACAVSLYISGMSSFDAIAHALSTTSIGGFSTHDASIGFYDSNTILWVTTIFMALSGINFALHFITWQQNSLRHYFQDSECKFYLWLLAVGIVITVWYLWLTETLPLEDAFYHGAFMLVSIATTTGFATQDFTSWPLFLPFLLFFMAFVGGSSGSTGGGMKAMRWVLLVRQGQRELYRLVHPNAIRHIKLNQKVVPSRVLESVWGFIAIYMLTFVMTWLVLMAMGYDFLTAFSAVAACINNLGPGMGDVAANYQSLGDGAKLLLSFTMLMGRLEVFTLLVLFTPTFWRD
ncbi:MAG: TrkH family potassium uptake protein [Pseudomonadales bacterium]|jgi:trk system potassium uptake protein TrkH